MPITFDPIGPAEAVNPTPSPANPAIATDRSPAALKLLRPGCPDGIACKATEVSETSMQVAASASAGLTLGQRFEVVAGHDCKDDAIASALGAGCYATVIRTAKVVAGDSVQATLRFDHPLPL